METVKCEECGEIFDRPQLKHTRCPNCGNWGDFYEIAPVQRTEPKFSPTVPAYAAVQPNEAGLY